MRITNRMLIDNIMQNIFEGAELILEAQDQVSSGKKVRLPSDDPTALERILSIRIDLDEVDQHLRSADLAQSLLTTADTALDQASDMLMRVRELTVQAVNSTMTPADRRAIAQEVEQLGSHLLELANTSIGGRYVFGGFKSDRAPFALDWTAEDGATASGDDGQVEQGVDLGVRIAVTLMPDADRGVGGARTFFLPLFRLLKDLRARLRGDSDTGGAPQPPDLPALLTRIDGQIDSVSDQRASIGARMNRLERLVARLQERQINLTGLKSSSEDADLAEALVKLNTHQAVYQAALNAGAKVIQPSLLNFLQ